jgi:NADPH:quinone reductase-like Zn-dependent oxidoreductase
MITPGGYGQYICMSSEWIVKLPGKMSLKESMIYGTAGFTAGFEFEKLEAAGLTLGLGEVLVTSATGGVGSLAVAIASKAVIKLMLQQENPIKEII